ncbi:MAG TPA: GTP-binding protein, partial [Anaerolineae bacterium]|nr:GTP-binding protein [Anaerolineae bacterium]
MRLLLIAGFLGSGKTTLTINLARAAVARGKKVAILVNEIGAIGIDNQLMRQLELNVFQLF